MSAHGDEGSVIERLSDGVDAATSLPRAGVHRAALKNLGSERMVQDYLVLYRELIAARRARA